MFNTLKDGAIAGLLLVCVMLGVSSGYANYQLKNEKLERAEERLKASNQYAVELSKARSEDARRVFVQKEALDAQVLETKSARADAARASAANSGVRDELARITAAYRKAAGNPTTPAGSTTVEALAQLLEGSIDAYRGMASDAEDARIAGSLCERSYDALITPKHD